MATAYAKVKYIVYQHVGILYIFSIVYRLYLDVISCLHGVCVSSLNRRGEGLAVQGTHDIDQGILT